ncbi:DUF523 domain-containing protein [Clostridium sartagoforme]|jgi:uncharacterized protein YbbK (DUF523 family)|uniref:Uncharacterized protein n=1 Tax=Clostridium sartagoforme AAU1 TaxID=1202534 RepID=R9CBP9_9CLOT|nr:DUF523 domain-containing protein [Clostridium sartagoforme]EOR26789.1 hypothetical protein A500_06923 [Clostridium sartagoforme AAU1]
MYIISSCLCGVNCKYSGGNNLNHKCLDLLKEGKAVLVCPEQLGGLPTPRTPAEIQGSSEGILNGNDKIITKENIDVTKEFLKGAYETLHIAKLSNINKAILKDGSPSCGVNYVYDGNFNGTKTQGKGLTATILDKYGIDVISDIDLEGE